VCTCMCGCLCVSACESGKYGKNCESTCGHCANDEPCNHVDGSCPNGCKPGYINMPLCTEPELVKKGREV
jgi:hypothetical protein